MSGDRGAVPAARSLDVVLLSAVVVLVVLASAITRGGGVEAEPFVAGIWVGVAATVGCCG